MQQEKLPMWAKITGYLLGAGMLFIGGRFWLAPEVAERGFGLLYDQPGNSFHYIKGIRDIFSGLLITIFTIVGWRKPLAVVVFAGSLIPIADTFIVLSAPVAVSGAEWIHGSTVVVLWVFGYFLVRPQTKLQVNRQPEVIH